MIIEEILAGKTVIGIKVKSPSAWLECDDGTWIELRAEGDCCSEAFIDATRLRNKPTLTGETNELTLPSFTTTQECDEVYAVEFLCKKTGYLAIMHRNSSNGYYGNYLSVTNRGTPPDDAVNGNDWHREIPR
jgi:hypothetical protein